MKVHITLFALLMLLGSFLFFAPKAEAQRDPIYEPAFFCCITAGGASEKIATICLPNGSKVCVPDTAGCVGICLF